MSAAIAILRRDITLALRQGGGLGPALGFILAVLVLVPLAVGPDQALLARLAPGIMWLTLLLGTLLTADRIFAQDLEDGTLELLMLTSTPFEAVALAKAVAHWLTVGLPLALVCPVLGFMLNLDAGQFGVLLLGMVLGSLALSLLASLGGAVTAGLRRGGLLVSLLILPLYVPVMIFGVSATTGIMTPSGAVPSLLVLGGLALAALVACPWAAAAALRVYLR